MSPLFLKIKTCVTRCEAMSYVYHTLRSLHAGRHPNDDTDYRRHAGAIRKPHHKVKVPSPQAQQILRELSQSFATFRHQMIEAAFGDSRIVAMTMRA